MNGDSYFIPIGPKAYTIMVRNNNTVGEPHSAMRRGGLGEILIVGGAGDPLANGSNMQVKPSPPLSGSHAKHFIEHLIPLCGRH